MALQTASLPSAQVVGNAFVKQYYHILHNSPELVYRFYQDVSVLSRPDSNGVMTSVTTMEGINKTILSLDFKNYKAEIKTADAQNSHKEGVTVLVTGCLTGKDNLRRKFAQSFFLAPQDNGYFVLNDVFRYVENSEDLLEKYPVNIVKDSLMVPLFSEPEAACASNPPAADLVISHVGEDQNISDKVHEPSDHERQFLDEKEAILVSQSHAVEDEVSAMVELASSLAQEDAPKKSYASIVKVAKSSSGHNKIYGPTNTAKVTHKKTDNQSLRSERPASHSETSAPVSINITESNNAHDEAESCSIYVRNLPINITATELEVEFKKFGPIKQGGIQVRHSKDFCFGFVEFQSSSSMDNAIQASPITIGGQEAVVEKKKNTRGKFKAFGSGRSRHSFERERFRNDNFRRGNYSGGWAYRRNEYGNWGEFTGLGRGSTGHGDSYQRGRGRGRGDRSGGLKQKAIISA